MCKVIELFRDRNRVNELREESQELNTELVLIMSRLPSNEETRQLRHKATMVNTEALFASPSLSKKVVKPILIRQVDGLKELIEKCKDNGNRNSYDHQKIKDRERWN